MKTILIFKDSDFKDCSGSGASVIQSMHFRKLTTFGSDAIQAIEYPSLQTIPVQASDYLLLPDDIFMIGKDCDNAYNPFVQIEAIKHNDTDTDVRIFSRILHSQNNYANSYLSSEILESIHSFAAARRLAPQAPEGVRAINYFLLQATVDTSAVASIVNINPQLEGILQSGDIVSYQLVDYEISSICWDLSVTGQVNAYLITVSNPGVRSQSSEEREKIDSTQDVRVFKNNLCYHNRYEKLKKRVKSESEASISHKIRKFILNKFRIKTFLGNSGRRMMRNASKDLASYAVENAGNFIPLPYASNIWSFGVDVAKECMPASIGNFFESKMKPEKSQFALTQMIQDAEFNYEKFSQRLNYAYWEIMEQYQKVLFSDANLAGSERPASIDEHCKNLAHWDNLRDEVSDYAVFLKNIVLTMEKDLHCMNASMGHVVSKFEKDILEKRVSDNALRKPVAIVAH